MLIDLPAIYIPGFNKKVFYQGPIGWEWGLVVGMTIVFIVWCEIWKMIRKPLYRRWTPPPVQVDSYAASEQASTVTSEAEKKKEKS